MSRPQVTITLGRSGQVVKREGNALNGSRPSPLPLSGSKRSMRDRLGGNADNVLSGGHSSGKRQRGDINGNGISNGVQDLHVKLIQKNKEKQVLYEKYGSRSKANTATMSTWSRQQMCEPKQESSLHKIPPTRSADDLLQLNSVEKSSSSWDGQRHGSPHRVTGASREFSLRYGSPDRKVGSSSGLSPLKVINGQHQILSHRPAEGLRAPPYAGKDVYDHARPLVMRTTSSLEATRPIPQQHPQSSILQHGSYLEPLTIGNFLNSLGLGKYAILFQAEEIDMTVLKHMQDNDLKELGIPMGPRRKILLSLVSLSRRI